MTYPPPAKLLKALKTELGRIDQALTYEFSNVENGIKEFVISADGVITSFPSVKRLAASAPPLPNWKVTAFRQRAGTGLEFEMGGLRLSAADIWFRVQELPAGGVAVTYFVRGLTPENLRSLATAVVVLADAAVGEYDAVMKIRGASWVTLPEDPASAGLKPFEELPRCIDSIQVPEFN